MLGGEDLGTLYVTTARIMLTAEELAREPLAGSVFALDAGVVGLREASFPGCSGIDRRLILSLSKKGCRRSSSFDKLSMRISKLRVLTFRHEIAQIRTWGGPVARSVFSEPYQGGKTVCAV